jgi:hypothetical protein
MKTKLWPYSDQSKAQNLDGTHRVLASCVARVLVNSATEGKVTGKIDGPAMTFFLAMSQFPDATFCAAYRGRGQDISDIPEVHRFFD